jgi:hypothetical protein
MHESTTMVSPLQGRALFGHVLLGFATRQSVFFFGLLVIVLGTALLKPNISAIVAAAAMLVLAPLAKRWSGGVH